MNDRLALLSAVLANPADDLPRLVFADWLDENGTTDADAARAEFIRLGCKGKAKSRISPGETKWLDANWRRLLGTTVAARPKPAKLPLMQRDGRFVRLLFRWLLSERVYVSELAFEFVRGFARRVEYLQGHTYQRFWQATATDEPLAYHRPELPPDVREGDLSARLRSTTWGPTVFARTTGFDAVEAGAWVCKVFRGVKPDTAAAVRGFHPLAVADEIPLIVFPQHRLRAAVATAMTALAREHVGLAPPAG